MCIIAHGVQKTSSYRILAASEAIVGVPLATGNRLLGLAEGLLTEDEIPDYVEWRQRPRCEGYLQRLAEHEGRLEAAIIPYG